MGNVFERKRYLAIFEVLYWHLGGDSEIINIRN
jgi:hypothetical protein